MDSRSPQQSGEPKRLKTLAAGVRFSGGNLLLHQFVSDNSPPSTSVSENSINAVLLCMSGVAADVLNARNDEGYTALHLAVLKDNPLMVKKLLERLADVDVDARCLREEYGIIDAGCTALHLAAKWGHLSVVRELLHRGAAVDAQNEWRKTPLCCAVELRHSNVVELLLSRGANVNYMSPSGCPLSFASKGDLEAVKYLVGRGADVNLGGLPLCNAAGNGSLAIAEFLVRNGAKVNGRSIHTSTPLHCAVSYRSLEIVQFLVRNGADVNIRDGNLQTPLHHAARSRYKFRNSTNSPNSTNSEIVEYLLSSGADVDARDWARYTPLHRALNSRNSEIKYFLRFGNVVRSAKRKIAEMLIEEGADLRAIDEEGKTPRHDAVWEESARLVSSCAQLSGEGDLQDYGWSGLDGVYRSFGKVIRKLLDRGADVNARNIGGETPLDLARNQTCVDALKET